MSEDHIGPLTPGQELYVSFVEEFLLNNSLIFRTFRPGLVFSFETSIAIKLISNFGFYIWRWTEIIIMKLMTMITRLQRRIYLSPGLFFTNILYGKIRPLLSLWPILVWKVFGTLSAIFTWSSSPGISGPMKDFIVVFCRITAVKCWSRAWKVFSLPWNSARNLICFLPVFEIQTIEYDHFDADKRISSSVCVLASCQEGPFMGAVLLCFLYFLEYHTAQT